MLPRNGDVVTGHANLSNSDPSALEKFRADNPQLVPVKWDGRGKFCDQLWHIAFLNHREYMEPECCYNSSIDSCITDHRELWQDRETLDLVHVAHPYCDGTDKGFMEGVAILARRGLNCAMTDASWYYRGHSNLVVAARPKTLKRVSFGNLLHLYEGKDEWDAEKIVAMQKAGEQVDSDRRFVDAKDAEKRGNPSHAFELLLDAAHTERTGRFHRHAVKCLREAGRVLRDHYPNAVLVLATHFLTHADVRMVFRFAGIEVPVWLERIWRNHRRPDTWGFRTERKKDGKGWIEYYRCVVCEEWIRDGDLTGDITYNANLGTMHSGPDCLLRVSGLPVTQIGSGSST